MRIELIDRVRFAMMKPEVAGAINVQAHAGHTELHDRSDVGATAATLDVAGPNALEQLADLLYHSKCLIGAGKPEPLWLENTSIGLDGKYMILDLVAMRIAVGVAAAQS